MVAKFLGRCAMVRKKKKEKEQSTRSSWPEPFKKWKVRSEQRLHSVPRLALMRPGLSQPFTHSRLPPMHVDSRLVCSKATSYLQVN